MSRAGVEAVVTKVMADEKFRRKLKENPDATLSGFDLTPEEAGRFSSQFSRIFEFLGELQQLDVSHIHATAQVIPLRNVLREDLVTPCLSREAALENAPEKEGAYFKTPRILQ